MKKKQVHQHKTKMKESFGDRMVGVVCYIIFGLCALVCVYPFYYIFINTISANDLSARGVILFWPRGIHFQNYVSALKIDGLFQAVKNFSWKNSNRNILYCRCISILRLYVYSGRYVAQKVLVQNFSCNDVL